MNVPPVTGGRRTTIAVAKFPSISFLPPVAGMLGRVKILPPDQTVVMFPTTHRPGESRPSRRELGTSDRPAGVSGSPSVRRPHRATHATVAPDEDTGARLGARGHHRAVATHALAVHGETETWLGVRRHHRAGATHAFAVLGDAETGLGLGHRDRSG